MSAALPNEVNAVRENERLSNLNQSGRFAIGAVPQNLREPVSQALDLAAARAEEVAASFPYVIAVSNALYSGETRNGRQHGHGAMTFTRRRHVSAAYRGEFADGKRAGLGVRVADKGLLRSGHWSANEASGFGILVAPDGRRFEGLVKSDASATPVAEQGWNWSAPDTMHRTTMHHCGRTLSTSSCCGVASASS